MIQKLLRNITTQKQTERRAELYRNLIRHEARIGGEVFGPIGPNRRREFFCLDEHTWVWHEEWQDVQGQSHVQTTRYDIRPNMIIKSQGGKYQPVARREAGRLLAAMQQYRTRIQHDIYDYVH